MELPARVRALLHEHQTLVLATERNGRPWVASVYYAPDLGAQPPLLICALLATSRKLANLRHNPRVALYIGPREPTRWLQAEGAAEILEKEDDVAGALARLTEHAPAARVFIERVPVAPVRITLERIKLTDLTGAQPPVESWPAGDGPESAQNGAGDGV